MKYLWDNWDEVEKKIEGKCIVLCLDYDGTLTPIAATPDRAVLSRDSKVILENLAKQPRCVLVMISGRALADLKEKINIKGIMYIGNHGLEINGPQLHFESLASPREKTTMDHLKEDLTRNLSDIEGVWVEDKGLTLSVHYRLVKEADEPLVKKIFQKTCRPYWTEKKILLTTGKKILEVRPQNNWDKGKALLWLLAKERLVHRPEEIIPVVIGDDQTDEDAFAAIAGKGVGIVVGQGGHSHAEYFLENTHEVTVFLKCIQMFLTAQVATER